LLLELLGGRIDRTRKSANGLNTSEFLIVGLFAQLVTDVGHEGHRLVTYRLARRSCGFAHV
jgi:hypothetical protein